MDQKKTHSLSLCLPLLWLALPTRAQAQTPTGNALDYVSWVTQAIDSLVTGHMALFVSDGFILAKLIAVYLLIVRGATYMLRGVSAHWPVTPLDDLGIFLAKFLAVLGMLHYYATPLPGVSFSFHQIFTETGRNLAAVIDLSLREEFIKQVATLVANIQKPSFTDILGIITYVSVLIDMGIAEAALFVITCFAFIAVGVGSLVGPLLIPFYLWPTQAGKFYRWLDFMVVYSFYRVVANAFVYVWVRVLIDFFKTAIHGDYSLAHLLRLIVPLMVLNLAFIWSLFKVPSIAAELFGGMGNVGAMISAEIRALLRAAAV